jgi:hypothetical protein
MPPWFSHDHCPNSHEVTQLKKCISRRATQHSSQNQHLRVRMLCGRTVDERIRRNPVKFSVRLRLY